MLPLKRMILRTVGVSIMVVLPLTCVQSLEPPGRESDIQGSSTVAYTSPIHGPTYVGAIIPEAQASEAQVLTRGKIEGYWTPSETDIRELEARLEGALRAGLHQPARISLFPPESQSGVDAERREITQIVSQLSSYRRQYVGVVVSGSRRIWVNCFRDDDADGNDSFGYWLGSIVQVEDGGNNFWQIQYDVVKMQFVEFTSNGYA